MSEELHLPTGTTDGTAADTQLSSETIARSLHPLFDRQIINYGAYNLVYATGTSSYRNPDVAALQGADQDHFLIGYRESPDEVIVAPIDPHTLETTGTATTIDNTNALQAYKVGDHSVGLESINGSRFLLTLIDEPQIHTPEGRGVLAQARDAAEFREFVTSIWPVL
ncbi:MAG: hypothetical protein Q4P78_07395 [Rothia sp. (in: high G+C Gram-positive bacteria)]|uniref:hypothetical protein n=1 Tax=Rothia sp. (in: high G+C Gram-positive bacteria) TaxID=1885016 RepID=UPI0026E089A7|nr:hypothetical protein [Rothia sp. (in: high G+C Gram-positive bacteria)]MDO5751003.1 hypothetical protein [Rothia sp. (in: high G+C Gram-positive bacteria)]